MCKLVFHGYLNSHSTPKTTPNTASRTQYTCFHSIYTVLFLLLVARDVVGCSSLVSYVAGDVAGNRPAWVKDEIIKN